MKTIIIKIEEKEENKPIISMNIKNGKSFTRCENVTCNYLYNTFGHAINEIGTLQSDNLKIKNKTKTEN